MAEPVVRFRYGRLENKVGSYDRLNNREDRLETVVIEAVSVSDNFPEGSIGEGNVD